MQSLNQTPTCKRVGQGLLTSGYPKLCITDYVLGKHHSQRFHHEINFRCLSFLSKRRKYWSLLNKWYVSETGHLGRCPILERPTIIAVLLINLGWHCIMTPKVSSSTEWHCSFFKCNRENFLWIPKVWHECNFWNWMHNLILCICILHVLVNQW